MDGLRYIHSAVTKEMAAHIEVTKSALNCVAQVTASANFAQNTAAAVAVVNLHMLMFP